MTRTLLALLVGAATILVAAELDAPSLTAEAAEGSGLPATQVQAAATTTTPKQARSGEQAFNDECGACHMAFPPQFLPARSWQAIMAGLDNHFGENASLDSDTAKLITDYLVANAAGPGSPVLRYLDPQETPLRITETRLWQRIHEEVSPSVFSRPEIKSKSNCLACHGRGGRGGDD